MTALVMLPLAAFLALTPLLFQEARPPSARETNELIEAYFLADGRTDEGLAEQRRVVARLDEGPELTASQAKTWRKKLLKVWSKGRKLEKDSGKAFFFEEEERGLFIVGGETKRPKGLLLCMHGGGVGSGDAWSAHSGYNPAAKDLDWLAIYPEVLKKTARGWTDSGTEEFVMDLVECARRTWKIDPNRVYFAGHSMGGSIALHTALREPEISGLILMNPGIISDGVPKFTKYMPFPFQRISAKQFGDRKFREGFLKVSYVNPELVTEQVMDDLQLASKSEGYLAGSTSMMGQYADPPALSLLNDITVPTLIAWGLQDRNKPRSELDQLRDALTDTKVEVVAVEKSGHYVHEEGAAPVAKAMKAMVPDWL